MNPENPIILLLEDCAMTARIVEKTLMNALPQCRLLWARSVEDATARSEGMEIALFVIDIELPDGNGLDFLWNMSSEHPQARAIVMTANPRWEYQTNSQALGVVEFFEKPVDLPKLVELVHELLAAEDADGPLDDFRATLEKVTPVDLIQLKCLTNVTTVMEFRCAGQFGTIRFERGQITDANTGELRGEEALFEIIGWKHGRVSEQRSVGLCERTIHGSWEGLLMDAAQRLDEGRAVA